MLRYIGFHFAIVFLQKEDTQSASGDQVIVMMYLNAVQIKKNAAADVAVVKFKTKCLCKYYENQAFIKSQIQSSPFTGKSLICNYFTFRFVRFF